MDESLRRLTIIWGDILVEGGKDFGSRLDLAIIAKSEWKNYENN